MSQCFVCDKHLQRCDITNDFSRENFTVTVRKIIGDDYLLFFGEEDHLCRACQNLLLRIVRLEDEEKTNILAMGDLLQKKYSLDLPKNQTEDSKELRQRDLESETEHCFVCDKTLQSSDLNTDYSRNDLIDIIRKIVGERCFMVIKNEDHLCQTCQDLMSKIQSKGVELRTMKLAMRALLRIKYSLDFNNLGMVGSSSEDSSALSLKRPVTSIESFPVFSHKSLSQKESITKSAVKSNLAISEKSKIDLNSSKIATSTPNKATVMNRKSLEVSSSKTILGNINSTQSLELEDFNLKSSTLVEEEANFSVDKSSVKENGPIENLNSFQSKAEDSVHQNSLTFLKDESHQGCCGGDGEIVCSKSKTKIGFHKSDHKKCLKHKVAKPFKCGRCKFRYSKPEELEKHNLEMKSREDFYCEICDFNFHLKNLISQHKSNHSPTNLMRHCKLCTQSIYDSLHLRYHIYTVHRGEPAHKCSYCNRTFLWKRQLNRHFYRYHEKKPAFTCEKCKKVYGDKVKYLKHIEFFHRNSYRCKICFKSFKNVDSLCLHERAHTKVTTYKCQYCFKKYRNLDNRRLHEERHTGNFEYKCDSCGLGFKQLAWFEKHKAKNTCARSLYGYIHHPTMCEICGKIYSNRISFKNHHLLHENPEPFECDICFKKLRYKQKLYYHKKRYHPESLAATESTYA